MRKIFKYRYTPVISAGVLFLLVLFTVSIAEKGTESKDASAINLKNELVEAEIYEKLPEFPVFHGVGPRRELSKTDNGYTIDILVDETVDTATFWYYDELEEEGWNIVEAPDIENESIQTITAEKEGYIVIVEASAEGALTKVYVRVFSTNAN